MTDAHAGHPDDSSDEPRNEEVRIGPPAEQPDTGDLVWTDRREDLVGTGGVIETKPTPEQAQHWDMQKMVLWGIGTIFFFTLLTLVLTVAFGGISEQLASELARMILPTVLGSASTIIGVLFVTGSKRQK